MRPPLVPMAELAVMRWNILAKYSVLMCGIAAVLYTSDAVLYICGRYNN